MYCQNPWIIIIPTKPLNSNVSNFLLFYSLFIRQIWICLVSIIWKKWDWSFWLSRAVFSDLFQHGFTYSFQVPGLDFVVIWVWTLNQTIHFVCSKQIHYLGSDNITFRKWMSIVWIRFSPKVCLFVWIRFWVNIFSNLGSTLLIRH